MPTEDDNPLVPEQPATVEPGPQSLKPVASPHFTRFQEASVASEFPGPARRPLPDDLRVPWDWIDILLLTVLAFGGRYLVNLLILAALGLTHVSLARIQKSPDTMSVIVVVAQVLLDLGLLAYLAAQMRLRFHSPFWRTIGWRPLVTHSSSRTLSYMALVFSGFLLAAMVAFAEPLFPPKHALPIQTITRNPHAALLFMLTAVLLAPVVEETLFRGYLYPVVARSFGVGLGVVVTGTLFGLLHAVQLWGGWWQIALLVVVGILFTIARAVTRTVVASYILHASYNALPVIATLLSSVKLRHVPPLH
jgi:uncharacterized protein